MQGGAYRGGGGVDTQGVCEWGWGLELKLNRKKEKIGFQRGAVATPLTPPLDPPLGYASYAL